MNALTPLKVEPAIARKRQDVQAIRIYPTRVLLKEIDSTVECGETPCILIKKTVRRGVEEVELVFEGPYHVEDISYATKDPRTWSTFGLIVTTPKQAIEFAEKIKQIAETPATEPQQMLLQRVQNMTVSRQYLNEMLRMMLASRPPSRSHAPSRRRRR